MTTQDVSDDDFSALEDTVSVTCGSMVERILLPHPFDENPVPSYRLVHLSAKEYLLLDQKRVAKSASAWEFWKQRSMFSISSRCLHYLLYSFPSQPTSRGIGHQDRAKSLSQSFPLSHYAAAHWIDHLWDLVCLEGLKIEALPDICRDLEAKVSEFLRHQLTVKAWIECCYVFQCATQHKKLRQWVDWAREALYDGTRCAGVLEDLTELADDLEKLDAEWGMRLHAEPYIIWEECTAFTTSRFMPLNPMFTVHTWGLQPLDGRGNEAIKSLVRISQTSADGKYVSALSIWPSRYVARLLCLALPTSRKP